MNIVLCGMPASGKTTVAKALASRLNRVLLDTDALIVSAYGAIPEIFEKYGEAGFRERESLAVERAASSENAVIATGGGAVTVQKNVETLKKTGKIVYLRAKIQTLISRAERGEGRPLLSGDFESKLRALYARRSGIYEGVADYIIDVDSLLPEQIAIKIAEELL